MEQSIWDRFDMLDKVVAALREVPEAANGSGRPYMTSYQLAIKIDRAHPDLLGELGRKIGGNGTGRRESFAQYLGIELARQSKAADSWVEMMYLSNDEAVDMRFKAARGGEVTSSLTGTGFFTSLFRHREPSQAS